MEHTILITATSLWRVCYNFWVTWHRPRPFTGFMACGEQQAVVYTISLLNGKGNFDHHSSKIYKPIVLKIKVKKHVRVPPHMAHAVVKIEWKSCIAYPVCHHFCSTLCFFNSSRSPSCGYRRRLTQSDVLLLKTLVFGRWNTFWGSRWRESSPMFSGQRSPQT